MIPDGFGDKVSFVWKIADKVRGHSTPREHGTLILPTLVLFRLDTVPESTRDAAFANAVDLDPMGTGAVRLLKKAAKQPFLKTPAR